MTAAMGVGAVVGGLLVAARGRTGLRPLVARRGRVRRRDGARRARAEPRRRAASRSRSPAARASRSCRPATRRCSSPPTPAMRGRVMSLWFVAFQGSTPIGGPIVGAVMAVAGARAGLGLGAITCALVAVAGLIALGGPRVLHGHGDGAAAGAVARRASTLTRARGRIRISPPGPPAQRDAREAWGESADIPHKSPKASSQRPENHLRSSGRCITRSLRDAALARDRCA